MENQNKPKCCPSKDKDNDAKSIKKGIMYSLIPHTGCIAFIIFSIIGATSAASVFKPLLMSRHLFYGLLAMSFFFACISAAIYLRKRNILSIDGVKSKKLYLAVLFGSIIFTNMLFFFVIFPYAANANINAGINAFVTGSAAAETSILTIAVDIPCSGHALLIIGDIKAIVGVLDVKFSIPNTFTVYYDKNIVSEKEILNIEIFKTYSATKIYKE